MAVYEYKGLTTEGRDISGIIDADSPKTARAKLRQSGIYPTDVVEGAGEVSYGAGSSIQTDRSGQPLSWRSRIRVAERVGMMEVSLMTRHLATLTAAKLPLMEALSALMDQLEKGELKRIVAGIRERVKEGSSLAVALAQYPSVFSEIYINMVRAGEASGTLDGMLLRLADYLEYQVKLRNQLIATLTYPLFMVVIGGLILFGLVTFVVPKITLIFEEVHQVLPLPTVILIAVSHFLNGYWWVILLAGALGIFALQQYIKTPAGRIQYDRFLLRMPVMGRVTLMVAISRFTRTLSTLLTSGVPLLQALDVVRNVVQNAVLAEAIDRARQNIGEGQSLAEPLRKSGMFPPLVTHMIAVGEKSGELEPMLIKVSEAYDNEVEAIIGTLTALLTPVMILVMGAIIGFIVMAILLPIFELSQIVR
ncbi:MAG TPA: type II secretion system inner membrane protein GspF [Nitrospiria bacterium]|jgi:general secretion pathway protein F|nr:type II secretion system inner membrane protein GspF [Nitrospiria bacterium]